MSSITDLTTSEQINELATALAKAQGEMGGAVKDAANPFFKSKYADLASVWDACRGSLSKHGLAVIQSPSADGVRVSVDTLLTHASGQWMRGTVSVSAKEDSPQAVGSCITYLRRYALQSFVGVAPEDDDAEAAEGRPKGKQAVVAPTIPQGYDDWLADMSLVVDDGIDRFRKAFKDSKPEYRDYLTKDPKRLDRMVKAANEATAAKPKQSVSA